MSEVIDIEPGCGIPTSEVAFVRPEPLDVFIQRAASDRSFDLDKFERLIALKERLAAKQAEADFNSAMREVQAELPAVWRDAENPSNKSRYARLETVNEIIRPVYTRHGFSLSFGTADCPIEHHYRVTCHVAHVGGHSRQYQVDVALDNVGPGGNANKTKVQGFGSTISYSRRYLLLMIFNISLTLEDADAQPQPHPDRDASAPKVETREQRSKLETKIAAFAAAWKAKNPQNLGESQAQYKARYLEWVRLKLALPHPDAEIAWTDKAVDSLTRYL